MDTVKQGAFQALVATASDKSDTVKDTLMYLVQKAGILFGFSAVTFTMFGYALLNFPAAARPFVYMHWVRLPWLKFEEPSVRACFGFFHGILRTKYIAIQSPLNGITVPAWVTSPESHPNQNEPVPRNDSHAESISSSSLEAVTCQEDKLLCDSVARPEDLFSRDERPIIIYFHGNCSNRGEPHRLDLYNFLSALSFSATKTAQITAFEGEVIRSREDTDHKNHKNQAPQVPKISGVDISLSSCGSAYFPPAPSQPVQNPEGSGSVSQDDSSSITPTSEPISSPSESSLIGSMLSFVQDLPQIFLGSSQSSSAEANSNSLSSSFSSSFSSFSPFSPFSSSQSSTFSSQTSNSHRAHACLLSAPNAHVVSFDYRGFGDNTSSNKAIITSRARYYNRETRERTCQPAYSFSKLSTPPKSLVLESGLGLGSGLAMGSGLESPKPTSVSPSSLRPTKSLLSSKSSKVSNVSKSPKFAQSSPRPILSPRSPTTFRLPQLSSNGTLAEHDDSSLEFTPPSPTGLKDDALAVWDWLTQRCGVPGSRIFILGHSLGTAVTAKVAHAITDRAVARVASDRLVSLRMQNAEIQAALEFNSASIQKDEEMEEKYPEETTPHVVPSHDENYSSLNLVRDYIPSFNVRDMIPAGVILESPLLSASDIAMSIPVINAITHTLCALGLPMRQIIRRGLRAHAFDSVAHWHCTLRNCEKAQAHFPIMVLHGECDAIVPVHQGESLFRHISNTKTHYRELYRAFYEGNSPVTTKNKIDSNENKAKLTITTNFTTSTPTGSTAVTLQNTRYSHPYKPIVKPTAVVTKSTNINIDQQHISFSAFERRDEELGEGRNTTDFAEPSDKSPLLSPVSPSFTKKKSNTNDSNIDAITATTTSEPIFSFEYVSDDMITECAPNDPLPFTALAEPSYSLNVRYQMPDHGGVHCRTFSPSPLSCVPTMTMTITKKLRNGRRVPRTLNTLEWHQNDEIERNGHVTCVSDNDESERDNESGLSSEEFQKKYFLDKEGKENISAPIHKLETIGVLAPCGTVNVTSAHHVPFSARESVTMLTVKRAFHDNLVHYDAAKIAIASFIKTHYVPPSERKRVESTSLSSLQ